MGWSYDDHTEFFNLPDLVEKFSLDRLNPFPAAITFTKLDHFNGLHMRSLEIPQPGESPHTLFREGRLHRRRAHPAESHPAAPARALSPWTTPPPWAASSSKRK